MKILFIFITLLSTVFTNVSYSKEINLEEINTIELKIFEFSTEKSFNLNNLSNIKWEPEKFYHRTFDRYADQTILIKKVLNFTGSVHATDHLAISLYNFSPAFEIYWDGKRIGSDGEVGDNGVLIKSAKVRYTVILDNIQTQKGSHTLLIRFYSKPMSIIKNGGAFFGYKDEFIKFQNSIIKERLFYLGFFLVITYFCLALYLIGGRNPSYLYFGIYSGFYSFISLWVFLIESGEISLLLYRIIEPPLRNSDGILSIILILFLLWHFKTPSKKYYLLISFVFLLISFTVPIIFSLNFRFSGYFIALPFDLIGLIIVINGLRRKIPGSSIAIASLILIIVSDLSYIAKELGLIRVEFILSSGKYITAFFILTLLLSVIVKIQIENNRYNDMQIRSKRLEAEMLKKSIQPHFILNTLLSFKGLIRRDGESAEELINSLAAEFKIIREISTMDKIPLSRELDLCKLHLKIMGFRRAAEYKLVIDSPDLNVLIPPLVLHTLIENGITHSFDPRENGQFNLNALIEGENLILIMKNGGSKISSDTELDENIDEGMGIAYIRSRLSETYGKNWKLKYGIEKGEWVVKITTPYEIINENSNT